MAMIILDGSNNVGKSTLVDWTLEHFDIPRYHHAGDDEEEPFVYRHIERWAESPDVAIFDRFFFTYMAYPVSGNWKHGFDCPISDKCIADTTKALKKSQANGNLLLIHAWRPLKDIMDYEIGLDPELRHPWVWEERGRLADKFDEIFKGWDHLTYNIMESESIAQTQQAITEFVKAH